MTIKRLVQIVASTIVLVYVAAMGYLYITQDAQVFNAKAIEKQAKVSVQNVENITLHVNEKVDLEGVYRKSTSDDAPLILYFGGNADDATRFVLHVKELEPFDIVTFNYRGFVGSTGKPSEKAVFEDALKIYDTYSKHKKVFVIGRSLGSGVASFVASQREVAGLVLITPYDSIVSMGEQKYPFLPIDFLLNHKFETLKYIPLVKAKIAIVEVENDMTIPRFHLQKLLEKMPREPLHVKLENITHGKVLEHPNFEKNLQIILGKLSE